MSQKLSETRAKDPAIREILVYIKSRNVQNPDFDAIKKILEEGADGRYLREVGDDVIVFNYGPDGAKPEVCEHKRVDITGRMFFFPDVCLDCKTYLS